jgi:hypothetical protein
VKYEHINKIIDQTGIKVNEHQQMCVDINEYMQQKFENVKTITLPGYSNRVNKIDTAICIAMPDDNIIKRYNTTGDCINTYGNTHQTVDIKQANNGDIITAGKEGLFVTNEEFTDWNLLHKGKYSNIAIHGNKFTAIAYEQREVVTFQYYNSKTDKYEWKLESTFKIDNSLVKGLSFDRRTTLAVVKKGKSVIICQGNRLLVYLNTGQYVKTLKLSSDIKNRIAGSDNKGNLILCEYNTGKIDSISDIEQFNSDNIEQYYVTTKNNGIQDMVIDCDKNIWILYEDNQNYNYRYYFTKYVPIK